MSDVLQPGTSVPGLNALKEQMAGTANCSNLRRPYLVGIDHETGTLKLYRPDCGLWSCPQCAQRNRLHWMHRIAEGVDVYMRAGERWSFATLTANRKRSGFDKTLSDWRHHWPVLYRRIKRYVAPSELHFVMMPERHKNGRVHMHVLWSAVFPGVKAYRKKTGETYFRSRWLTDNCNGVGLGWIHDNRKIDNSMAAVSYVTKYLVKSTVTEDWPDNLRRVRTSHHWPIPDVKYRPDALDWQTFTSWAFCEDYLRWAINQGYHLSGLYRSE